MPASFDCDVLIIGAGPTGVTLGLALARQGVRTLMIDKEDGIYPLPRAAHIDHEAVRIFQNLGVAADVLKASRPASRYDFLNAKGEVLMRFDGTDKIGPGGWPISNMVHQPSLEAALRDAARAQANLELKTGWKWLSYTEYPDQVASEIATPQGHTQIRSRFIVGADGARSPVRSAAGIEQDDLHFDENWLVVDALVRDPERLPKVNLQICDPARPTTCVVMGSGRHRWEFMLKPGETADDMLDDRVIEGLLKPWNVEGAVTLERKAVYRFNAMLAKSWVKGPVILAGDAAHLMPPFAGQGLCSGLRDAANLSWKLAAVVHGADQQLLDTYQQEREPHVRAIIALAIMMGQTVCVTDPEAAAKRDVEMLAARAGGAEIDGALSFPPIAKGAVLEGTAAAGTYFPQPVEGNLRLDDVLGPGAWLIAPSPYSPSTDQYALTLAVITDARLAPFRASLSAWFDANQAPAVLVRPDRTVFGTAAPDALARAWGSTTRVTPA